jgi:hypothetical protein
MTDQPKGARRPVSVEQAFKILLDDIGVRYNCRWELDRWMSQWLDLHLAEHHAREAKLQRELAEVRAEYANVCKFATQYEHERDRLKAELEETRKNWAESEQRLNEKFASVLVERMPTHMIDVDFIEIVLGAPTSPWKSRVGLPSGCTQIILI